jgi:hypothetical protein
MAFSLTRLLFISARHGTVSYAIHMGLSTARRCGNAVSEIGGRCLPPIILAKMDDTGRRRPASSTMGFSV